MSEGAGAEKSFWEHLDDLRGCLLKILVAVAVLTVVAFIAKEPLFAIVLAPQRDSFITYRLLDRIASLWGSEAGSFSVSLINTGLTRQFMVHMTTAFYAALLCTSPYIIYQLFRFVSPALYVNEKRYARKAVTYGYLLFWIGILVGYFLLFPLTFRFLGTYQVSGEVVNLISLQSYMDTLMVLLLLMGLLFELPLLCCLFARMGLLTADFMRRYRRHALVVIFIVAAIITPTADAFTLMAVALPIYLLWEGSIFLVKRQEKRG
ncbi:MAG: twin-arginine translocase subunit TatC [Porphyromonadaceae bacterium]|nr:twin-arginine translocase subunit TatC [Porphyromonadaceae bacterium]